MFVLGEELFRQTDGFRFVTSRGAIFDADFHGILLFVRCRLHLFISTIAGSPKKEFRRRDLTSLFAFPFLVVYAPVKIHEGGWSWTGVNAAETSLSPLRTR